MCGIAGFVAASAGSSPEAVLERMTGVIRHRGPDDSGKFCDGVAFLGHRRLSIIDLAAGHQPMSNETGDVWIVYNGEIFNHSDLRPELEHAGHRYGSHCDTETIIHAWEQYGADCLQSFRGMFAFALWDTRTQRLFCARDRLGIKPLYYYWDGSFFAFASEIKALLEHPRISAGLEPEVLAEYIGFGYVSEERTLFSRIRRLMPGHYLTLDARTWKLETRQYWDVPPHTEPERRDDESWIRECRQRLEETVRMRLMSDVPLGMFLSGGVDSSAIAALMKRMVSGPVKSFAVGYREAAYSELGYARQVSEAIGTEHQEVVIGMDDFFNALPRLVWQEDEPITWPSSISLHFVSQLAAEQVKVVLTGEGSDELFAGYERYGHFLFNRTWMDRYRIVPAPLRALIRRQIADSSWLSASMRRKALHTFIGREDSLESLQLDNFYCAFSAGAGNRLFRDPALAGSMYANYLRYWESASSRPLIPRMLYCDQKTYLVELLMKQDQMSMSASIESRVPFLDHTFVEFAMRVPDHLKIRNGERKYILKKAVEDLLPRDIIYRKKMGFPTPLRQWLTQPSAAPIFDLLRSRDGVLAEYFDPAEIQRLIDVQRRGVEDATDRIWRLLNLQIWGEIFLHGRRNSVWDGIIQKAEALSAG
jgi:asparagine synthase (glutamine-hydrolysing)